MTQSTKCPRGWRCRAGLWCPPGAVSAVVSSVICPRTSAGPCQWLHNVGGIPFVRVGQHTHACPQATPRCCWSGLLPPAASRGPAPPVAGSTGTKSPHRDAGREHRHCHADICGAYGPGERGVAPGGQAPHLRRLHCPPPPPPPGLTL